MRERLSLDEGWRFALGHASDASKDFEFTRDRSLVKAGEARGAAGVKFDDSGWKQVNVPHDWAIALPLVERDEREHCEHGFFAIGPEHPENSVGWYRRTFEVPASDLGRRICVEFDGVFRDSVVWINGHRLGRHASGYVPFRYDLTDLLNYGGSNVLSVRVDATQYEGWWYEGAGIYRHVWLVKTDPLHVAPNGTFVTTRVGKTGAEVTVRTTVRNDGDAPAAFRITSEILDPAGKVIARARIAPARLADGASREVVQKLRINRPKLWSCDEPNLYRLRTTVTRGTKAVDVVETPFGIRTLRWDARRGFFLNGSPLKIKGTCNHQNHAGVGAAMPDALHEWRLLKLKELGSNAYRCSHYCATRELLDACDRLGLLVMAENRLAGTGPEVLGQFEAMIRRDWNHPSIILWSLANEEHTVQWSIAGERIGRTMVRLAHRLDPTRKVTAAMHDRGLGEGFANVVDVHGWNYIKVGDIGAFHDRRPDQPIVGSEEGSTVTTRGVYADDAARGYVRAYDERSPKWGSTAEHWWTYFAERPWLAGGFLWTGFDYLGEPIPYKWPCTASHFGIMDLCGFPKDNYYYYRAWWRPEDPVLHLLPHWTWPGREGEAIDVRCFSNCDEVELFLNGASLGRQSMPRNSHLRWTVPYTPGILVARGYRAGKQVLTQKVESAGPPVALTATSSRTRLNADGADIAVIEIAARDSHNRFTPTASAPVHFTIEGPARLLGVGNGDPSSHEPHHAATRTLFNGRCVAIVQTTRSAGAIRVTAASDSLQSASITLRSARP